MLARHDRPRVYFLLIGYIALALAWLVFAGWFVPPLLIDEHPTRIVSAVTRYIRSFPSPFLARDIVGRWRQVTGMVLIAIFLHLTIVLLLRRFDRRASAGQTEAERAAGRRTSLWLAVLALGFLAVTVVFGPVHDYYYFLNMWYEVEQGHDPWFLVAGANGVVPLNAYGPLFNLLTGPFWVNPLAPKLLFAYAYILFAIGEIKCFTASHRPSAWSLAILTALFWNPFPWIEIAIRGHFDILVALLCLGAIRARVTGRDCVSGICLALGVLLKFLPVVLLPFLALDRGRIRPRFVVTALGAIALGLGLSYWLWGATMFSPLTFAATRKSNFLSIFYFLRGRFSPLNLFLAFTNCDKLAPFVLFVALLRAWQWYRTGQRGIEHACVVAVVVTAIFYHTGFPQYHMVPFVLGLSWALRYWELLRDRPARIIAVASYFGWLAVFEFYYLFVNDDSVAAYWFVVQEIVGLPMFLIGCAFLAAVVLTATEPAGRGVAVQPGSAEGDVVAARAGPTA